MSKSFESHSMRNLRRKNRIHLSLPKVKRKRLYCACTHLHAPFAHSAFVRIAFRYLCSNESIQWNEMCTREKRVAKIHKENCTAKVEFNIKIGTRQKFKRDSFIKNNISFGLKCTENFNLWSLAAITSTPTTAANTHSMENLAVNVEKILNHFSSAMKLRCTIYFQGIKLHELPDILPWWIFL